jgi:hypothetical protein
MFDELPELTEDPGVDVPQTVKDRVEAVAGIYRPKGGSSNYRTMTFWTDGCNYSEERGAEHAALFLEYARAYCKETGKSLRGRFDPETCSVRFCVTPVVLGRKAS